MAEMDITQLYKTCELEDPTRSASLQVVPERGGIITQWTVQDQAMLYLDLERFTHPELSVRGGIPILFPICGNLPSNTYSYQSQSYTLKQHGFARDLPWEVVDDSRPEQLTLKLQSNAQTLAVYPFAFEVDFTYQLQGNTLIIDQHYTNQSSTQMPFATGLHPYFRVQDKSALQVNLPATRFYDQRTQAEEPFTGAIAWDAEEVDWAFRELSAQTATVIDSNQSLQLTLSYDSHYSTLVFWTVKGKDYYCLEPWSAPRNALNTGEQLLYLSPGESLTTQVSFTATRL